MLPREILRQVRRLQLKARRAVEDMLGGEYHSVFKGTGIAFEEVRPYQPGDDVRSIDWNVTARMSQPFVKRYIEERERTVVLAVDASGSLGFGTGLLPKREVAAELAAVLAFSAISNNDRVGLVQFTDRIEHYLPPRKGPRHVLRLIRDVLFFQPEGRRTCLRAGLDHLARVIRRRAIVFLFSDFLDSDHEKPLRRTARRHELIAVRLSDPRERDLPAAGLVELEDAETGSRLIVDTRGEALRAAYRAAADERDAAVGRLMRSAGVDVIEASTDGKHLDELVRFFRRRQRRMRRAYR
jgi:uncharacterized protein (DUF58 family)